MDNSKYYFVKRKGDQAYPLCDILNMTDVEDGEADILQVEISDPPRKPVMADYLSSAKDIFSKRIADVMRSLNMEGVRFLPAEIDDTRGNTYDNYVCVVVDDNTYEALDKELSDFTYRNGRYRMKKIVLDKDVLNQIPLNKRLGFRLRESAGYYLYHQSVVDAVMTLEPTGMYFQDIEEYDFSF